MSKIHAFETKLSKEGAPRRSGYISCIYHVDMRSSKDEDVVPTNMVLSSRGNGPIVGDISVGYSSITSADIHPDFLGGGETNFPITSDAIPYLDNAQLPGALKDLFTPYGISITNYATVDVIIPSGEWNIQDVLYTHNIVNPDYGVAPGSGYIPADLDVVGEVDQEESIHIGNYDIAECRVNIKYNEGEPVSILAGRADNLYNTLENKVNQEYTKKYRFYGATRNPN